MEQDRMALLRELSAHIGRPDFDELVERVTREMQPVVNVVKPLPKPVGAPRRPATLPRRA
jgi:hypothetical protein